MRWLRKELPVLNDDTPGLKYQKEIPIRWQPTCLCTCDCVSLSVCVLVYVFVSVPVNLFTLCLLVYILTSLLVCVLV